MSHHPDGGKSARAPFYRLPKALFALDLSLEAITLYALMLDRLALSRRNGWTDQEGRVYIYFSQKEVQTRLRCGHNRATALVRELEGCGLVQRKRQGLGKPAMIFVQNCTNASAPQEPSRKTAENAPKAKSAPKTEETSRETARKNEDGQSDPSFFDNAQAVQTAPRRQSGAPREGSSDCRRRAPNKTEKKKAEGNETHRTHPQPPQRRRDRAREGQARMDEMRWVRKEIRENTGYDGLVRDFPYDQDLFDGYVELMTEAACSPNETVRVCGQDLPTAAVRSRLLKLDREHILYVRDCLSRAAAPIGNIKAYTLAALYNAPVTIHQYYAALVSRDLAAG